MLLWMSPTSPYARKCRILLREKRLVCEESSALAKGIDIVSRNPLGKIPALELDDGSILYDSVVIVEYLDAIVPEPRFIPAAPRERAEVRCWEALADGMADAVVNAMLDGRRQPERRDPGYVEKQHQKVRAGLEHIERRLERHGAIYDSSFSLADAAIVSALDYTELRAPELLGAGFPTLRDYMSRLAERSSVAETAPPRT
jgi:glutathione S-transferase